MKSIKGRYPERRREQIGNEDCKLNSFGKAILDIVGDFVHAVRIEDDVSSIQRDTMYMSPNIEINLSAIGEVSTTIDSSTPGIYEPLLHHINTSHSGCCKEFLELSGVRSSGPRYNAFKILLNDKTAGYYLPDINSWILGNWAWHDHYITIIMKWIWPQIVGQLRLVPCENSINNNMKNTGTRPRMTVSIGADPEFEIMKDGRVCKADTTLNIRNYTSQDIGLDGAGSQLEFRPKPGTPQQVVKNIRHLVKELSIRYPEIDLTDEGDKYPLGGHIHVGIGHPIDVHSELIMILDDFIGRPTLELSGKARQNYKFLGAVRSQPHGFEYRSTPSAVFQNPRIAHIVFTLMKNLCEKYFNGDVLKYGDMPNIEDYITVGGLTKHQTEYFMKFCKEYKSEKSIRSSWKVEPVKVPEIVIDPILQYVPNIEFRDDWNSDIASQIRQSIEESVLTRLPITISLYGLGRSRGNLLCTLQLSDTTYVQEDLPKPLWRGNTLSIGFSYDIRQRGLHRSIRSELVREISALIARKEASQ